MAIVPNLWFDGDAEQAATFYASIFPDSHVDNVARMGGDTPSGPAGVVILVQFTLMGQRFAGINGGPQFPFSEAISFEVECASQDEVDRYWDALLADGGTATQCGWLKDQFGVSWQVTPTEIGQYIAGPDPEGSRRATEAMLGQVKLDVAAIRAAYEGRN